MRLPRVLVTAGAVLSVLAGIVPGTVAAGGQAAAATTDGVTALYEMNEPVGSSVMTDSSGNGLNGVIDPTGVQTGAVFDGATGYNWVLRSPTAPPPSPERVIQVPDNINLEPGDQPFTLEMRYRTKEKFGNIIQKGQSASVGGQWKIQNPGGIPSCLFKGSLGQVATNSITPLNDDAWHTLTCVYTSTGVSMYVDGLYRSRKNGSAGTVDNHIPMTIGGKSDCDQIDVTCDYYSGQIDYVKITKGPNLPPHAAFSSSCVLLACTFDASASSDPDGSVASYVWDFGDDTTGTGVNPAHTYAATGTYTVTLNAVDNDGVPDRKISTVSVVAGQPPPSPVGFVGSRVAAASNNNPTATVPATAAGQRLVMLLSVNSLSPTVSAPTGVTGWTLLDTVVAKDMATTAWTKVAVAADVGAAVHVPLSVVAKYSLTVAAYSGADPGAAVTFARSADVTVQDTARLTPDVVAPAGSWVVSYWADKSSTTTGWTPGGSVTSRAAICAADSGRICSLLADTGAAVPAGTYGHISASTSAPSDKATMWSIVVKPDDQPPGNALPVADFSSSCTFLDCMFDSSASHDPDGSIVSFAWDFGDGATSTLALPSHHFGSGDSYQVKLTVTDDDAAAGSVTKTVTVAGQPPPSPVAFVGSRVAAASNNNPTATVPATAAGQRLVMLLSVNSLSPTVSAPTGVTGWTLLDTVVAKDMATTAWTKVAVAADVGAAVHVPLSVVAKYSLTVAAYSGADPGAAVTFARSADVTVQDTARLTPDVVAPAGSWVVSYWADKSSTTTGWTPGGSVTSRAAICAADSGRICSLLADTGAAVPAGTYGHISASTSAPSDKATMWSIVVKPAP